MQDPSLVDLSRTGSVEASLAVLRHGEIEVLGLTYELLGTRHRASNATLLATVAHDDVTTLAVYKPTIGERPLWDFPAGLGRREVAAFELSDAMGWDVIPPTVERVGPHGVGSLQLFVDADFTEHYFTLVEQPRLADDLRTICLFDLVANNTDRKSGHCLLSRWGRVYGIDQGLCFAEQDKVRTVIWDFAGERFSDTMLRALEQLAQGPPARLSRWLSDAEAEALAGRASCLLRLGEFPDDESGHGWPWPLV